MAKFVLGFVIFLQLHMVVQAQVQDTLEFARESAYQKNLSEANQILSLYNKNNKDVYGLWLQAQVAWWMGNEDRSFKLYEAAIRTAPELSDLKFDYAQTLFNAGRIEQAFPFLTNLLKLEPGHSGAKVLVSYIDYWNGKTSRAKKAAGEILATDPENEPAKKLLEEISVTTAPYVVLASSFASDDQPLEANAYSVSAGKYFSGYFSPFIKAATVDYVAQNIALRSYTLEAGNKFKLGMSGPELTLTGGLFKPDSNEDTTEFTGNVAISQKVVENLFLQFQATRMPYRYTLASLQDPLMQNLYSAALFYNNPEKLVGKVAYEQQFFPDENVIHTTYAYLLKSLINKKSFRFDLGYLINYSHSEKNTFVASGTPALRPGLDYEQGSGVYDPYFSPNNQLVNAALASVRLIPVDVLEIKLRSSYGFYAKADNPVFFATRSPGNQVEMNKFYYEQSYNPVEVFGEINLQAFRGLILGANFQYSNLLFYTYKQAGLTLNYTFL